MTDKNKQCQCQWERIVRRIGQTPTGDSNSAGPVVVQMAELVGEELVAIQRPAGEVVNDVVVRRRNGSLIGRLREGKE